MEAPSEFGHLVYRTRLETERPTMTKSEAGRIGGLRTVEVHGRGHMAASGRNREHALADTIGQGGGLANTVAPRLNAEGLTVPSVRA
jgi:hypothetical protein